MEGQETRTVLVKFKEINVSGTRYCVCACAGEGT